MDAMALTGTNMEITLAVDLLLAPRHFTILQCDLELLAFLRDTLSHQTSVLEPRRQIVDNLIEIRMDCTEVVLFAGMQA